MKANETLVILTDQSSPRLTYVLDEVIGRRLKLDYEIRSSDSEFGELENAISYSDKPRSGVVNLFSEGLLFESMVREELPKLRVEDDFATIFPASSQNEFDLSFDVFSAIFFCLTRYEEYVIGKRDQHGRFESSSSIFHGHHRAPYLDRWVHSLRTLLEDRFQFQFEEEQTVWYNTLDMDIAFAYKGRSPYRMLGAAAKDIINLKSDRWFERIKVLSGGMKDPFDTYSIFLEAKQAAERYVFIPTGDRSEFDNNLSISTSAMQSHIRSLGSKVNIGLHPSYASLNKSKKVAAEKKILEKAIALNVRYSRQHFLRFSLPDTFNVLESEGIEVDFSMGFHDDIGFRAGTAYPFSFYDLTADAPMHLMLYPLIAMDSAMHNYLMLHPSEATDALKELVAKMKMTGGAFISVWHNHSLSDQGEWEGWLEVYRSIPDLFHFQG